MVQLATQVINQIDFTTKKLIIFFQENGLYGYGADSGSGTYFENTIVVQYDPQVQEVWDQARKLRCTWHDQYEKSVTFRLVLRYFSWYEIFSL